jgi:hypothetical protein
MAEEFTYIGDGVYARFDGYQIELRANDVDKPTDIIYLEPQVLQSLNEFAKNHTVNAYPNKVKK